MDGLTHASSHFGTPRLVRVSGVRMELRARRDGARIVLALVAGCALGTSGVVSSLTESPWRVLLFVVLCSATLFGLLKRGAGQPYERHVFDLGQGRCFTGSDDAPQQIIPLPAIRALQVEDANDSHQLSLVLRDGSTAALAGYPRHDLAVADAGSISRLLQVPIRIDSEQSW